MTDQIKLKAYLINGKVLSLSSSILPFCINRREMRIKSLVLCFFVVQATSDGDAIEVLEFKIRGTDVDMWVKLDNEIWTDFLREQDGYISKVNDSFPEGLLL